MTLRLLEQAVMARTPFELAGLSPLVTIGGSRRDISDETRKSVLAKLDVIEKETDKVRGVVAHQMHMDGPGRDGGRTEQGGQQIEGLQAEFRLVVHHEGHGQGGGRGHFSRP